MPIARNNTDVFYRFIDFTGKPETREQIRDSVYSIDVAVSYKVESSRPEYERRGKKVFKKKTPNQEELQSLAEEYLAQDDVVAVSLSAESFSSSIMCSKLELIRCSVCKKFYEPTLFVERSARALCRSCSVEYMNCFFCGSYFLKNTVVYSSDGFGACPDCAELYELCPTCGRWRDPNVDSDFCPECKIKIEDKKRQTPAEVAEAQMQRDMERRDVLNRYRSGGIVSVHDYGHKPYPVFHSVKGESTSLYYGVELEVDGFAFDKLNVEDSANLLHAMSDNEQLFYLKYDASLEIGYEIVTHPCTLAYHKDNFPWDKIKKIVLSHKGRSHETNSCGLHIHFSSLAFGEYKSPKWNMNTLKLLNLVSCLWRQIVKFSRRKPNDMREWAARYIDDFKVTEKNTVKVGDLIAAPYRHRAVNLSCSDNTIEIRLFKGTLNNETIIASIEFVDYIVNWCINSSVETVQNLSWETFYGGIDGEKYPSLINYLARRGLCVS